MMRHSYLFALAFLLLSGHAFALSSDRSKPINIESDHKTIDYKQGRSHYEGRVVVTQGSMELHADSMDISHPKGQLNVVIMHGKPATFTQISDDGKRVNGRALTITYYAREKRLLLEKDGYLKFGEDDISSAFIEYFTDTEMANAGAQDGHDRVHITLQPQDEDAEPKK